MLYRQPRNAVLSPIDAMLKSLVILSVLIAASACSPPDASRSDVETEQPATRATSGLSSPAADTIPSDQTITIAADPWCPHNCQAGSEQEGYMVDITREILETAGFQVEYVNMSWARALQLTREGRLDAVVGAFINDAPDFVFPEVAQGHSRITFFTHQDSNWRYDGLESLENQTLLAINGYSYSGELDRYIQDHADEHEHVWILSGPAPLKRALYLLDKHRTDIFVEDDYVMSWALRAMKGFTPPREAGLLNENGIYVAFSPARADAHELAILLAEGTRRLEASGRIQEIKADYGLSTSE